ncbi:MAG: AAA family ATPase [Bacteroidetes bacterium]|nr:AAA family ATPase [Bacteroidota bacterium]
MILKAIRLKNVRQFTDPVEVNGIGPGVNVLAEPNEHGKSTVFDALHAVFFRDRKAQDKRIKSLKPYAGGDPEVEVEIDLDGTAYRIWKCWKGVRGSVKVFREGNPIQASGRSGGLDQGRAASA